MLSTDDGGSCNFGIFLNISAGPWIGWIYGKFFHLPPLLLVSKHVFQSENFQLTFFLSCSCWLRKMSCSFVPDHIAYILEISHFRIVSLSVLESYFSLTWNWLGDSINCLYSLAMNSGIKLSNIWEKINQFWVFPPKIKMSFAVVCFEERIWAIHWLQIDGLFLREGRNSPITLLSKFLVCWGCRNTCFKFSEWCACSLPQMQHILKVSA